MDIFIAVLIILAGMVMLVVGAIFFVDGASGVAKKMKISPLVIGMTIVAFGTSAPELAVSISAALSGSGDILMGNVVGSNIFNILLILGISSIICSLSVQKRTLAIEIPFLLVVSVVFTLFATVGGQTLEQWEGGVLIGLFVAYITYMVFCAISDRKKEKAMLSAEGAESSALLPVTEVPKKGLLGFYSKMQGKVWFLLIIFAVGLAGVIFGADFIVTNVNVLADMIPNDNARKILSVVVVALGTSLPELVTSVIAAIKKNADIAIGNIIGSNIFNIIFVAALPILIFGMTYTASYLVDMLVSIAAVAVLALCVGIGRGKRITRTGGIIMLVCLAGYMVYLMI